MRGEHAFAPSALPQILANLHHKTVSTLAALALSLTPAGVPTRVHSGVMAMPHANSLTRTTASRRTYATTPVVVFDKDYRIPTLLELQPMPPSVSRGSQRLPEHEARAKSLPPRPLLSCEIRVLTRLLVALVVGGIIGMERRAANSLAGVRTFSLVSLGAAIFMSTTLVSFPGADPTRVAAAISSGVGFLGAGAMHKDSTKHSRGLTTASSVWLAAALGIAAACGMFLLSFAGAISTVLIARYARFDSSLHLIRGDPLGEEEEEEERDGFMGKRFYQGSFDVQKQFEVSVVDFDPSSPKGFEAVDVKRKEGE